MIDQEKCIVIPQEKISETALMGLVEEFILREGTDYGSQEVTLTKKKEQVLRQLKNKTAIIVYSTLTENTSIMSASELRQQKTD